MTENLPLFGMYKTHGRWRQATTSTSMPLQVIDCQDAIPISYESGGYDVSFNLSFGPGNSSTVKDDRLRLEMGEVYKAYHAVVIEENEARGKFWVVVGREGPLLVRIAGMKVEERVGAVEKRMKTGSGPVRVEYAIGLVFDTKEPIYGSDDAKSVENKDSLDRDGNFWHVPVRKSYECFDQNGNGKWQLTLKRASSVFGDGSKASEASETTEASEAVKESEESKGSEGPKESEVCIESKEPKDDGVFWITFTLNSKTLPEFRTRGVFGNSDKGVVVHGDSVSTNSQKSEFTHVEGTRYFKVPVHYRVLKDTESWGGVFSRSAEERGKMVGLEPVSWAKSYCDE